MIQATIEVSNSEDWTLQFEATDAETGDAIIWTGADIAFELRDASGCTRITATTDGGEITLPDPTIVEIAITEDQLSALCAGNYTIGCVYELNSTKAQAFVGTVSIYDGIASL